MSPDARAALWVLDTNVVLDWLVFDDPSARALIRAIDERRIALVTRDDCREELRRVLAHAQLPASAAQRAAALARYDAVCVRYTGAHSCAVLPLCRDRSDQKFLELARDAGAGWLVSKDHALLRLARRTAALGLFRILDAAAAKAVLEGAYEPL
jgi:putative PIN family toxin of toxin-antitoxin system